MIKYLKTDTDNQIKFTLYNGSTKLKPQISSNLQMSGGFR